MCQLLQINSEIMDIIVITTTKIITADVLVSKENRTNIKPGIQKWNLHLEYHS